MNSDKKPNWCLNCPFLNNGHWLGNGNIQVVNISDTGICQFNCVYCTNANKNNKMSAEPLPDYARLLAALAKREVIDSDLLIKIGPDEITAHPQCDTVLEACSMYAAEIFTNAAIYKEKILNMLDNKKSSLLVSMDCGTKDTFAKIKGRDVYDKVCKNLVKYASRGGRIKLKYILLPGINDNLADADGFIELCDRIGMSGIMLAKNRNDKRDKRQLPRQTIDIAKYIYNKATERGYMVTFVDIFFDQSELELIKN